MVIGFSPICHGEDAGSSPARRKAKMLCDFDGRRAGLCKLQPVISQLALRLQTMEAGSVSRDKGLGTPIPTTDPPPKTLPTSFKKLALIE